MAAQQAALDVAKKGFGMMLTASKAAASAISAGVQKARKSYANQHELGVLNELKAKGLNPVEHLVESFKRLFLLLMAGYKNEVQAAASLCARRLTDPEKSTIPLDVATVLGGVLLEETLKFGDFQKNVVVQGMQDFLNKTRMGKDHYDRDSLAHDVYYAVLICAEEFGSDWEDMQMCFREAVARTVEWAGSKDISPEGRMRAAKSMFYLGQAVKLSAQQFEEKRQKNIKDAETILRSAEVQQRRKDAEGGSSASAYPSQRQPANAAPPAYENYSASGSPPRTTNSPPRTTGGSAPFPQQDDLFTTDPQSPPLADKRY